MTIEYGTLTLIEKDIIDFGLEYVHSLVMAHKLQVTA